MVESVNCVLCLTVEYGAVVDNYNRCEYRFIVLIVQFGKLISKPSDRITFAGAGGVLNKVIMPRTVVLNI